MHRSLRHPLAVAQARRDRLGTRVTVLGNALALAATAGTGVITGVLAHQAQAADLQKAQDKARAEAAARAAAGPVVRLVPKPVKVVTVKVRTPSGTRQVRKVVARRTTSTAPRTTTTTTRTTRTTTQAPAPSSNPPATTSSGS